MRIIEKGKPRQRSCPSCKCKFEYEVGDIYTVRTEFTEKEIFVVDCPQCNIRIHERKGYQVNKYGYRIKHK